MLAAGCNVASRGRTLARGSNALQQHTASCPLLNPHFANPAWTLLSPPPADLILTYYATEAAKWMAADKPSWR